TTRIDFPRSTSSEPHADRARAILARHPEIRRHFGWNAWSTLLIAALVALQTILAVWTHRQPWWIVLLVSYVVGAFATHALLVLVHECAHNLVFERRSLNRLAGILAGLDRKSTRLNSSHEWISYAVFCLKKKKVIQPDI